MHENAEAVYAEEVSVSHGDRYESAYRKAACQPVVRVSRRRDHTPHMVRPRAQSLVYAEGTPQRGVSGV
jgi:hypothetical protein